MHITERQVDILNFLIEKYIEKAEPISSGLIEEISCFNVSAATIRNELRELARKRYITQTHISGGRIPTDKGYRFYVDNLLNSGDLDFRWQKKINSVLAHISNEPREINKTIAQLLSDLSENVVIAGIANEGDFYKTGLANLFESPEFREINKIFRLTCFFDEFDRMFNNIEKEFFGQFSNDDTFEDINVFIGKENHHPGIKDETVMTARYNLPSNLVGSLTLIGPTRMDYKKNIGLVRYTTEKLNNLTRKT
ncbi:MAG: hypothetical protein AAB799_00615 [Patescibacteria group bacterium]